MMMRKQLRANAAGSCSYATPSSAIAPTSMQECPLEISRNPPARHICGADLLADGSGVAGDDRVAPGRGPFRAAAPRLAPGAVCLRRVHNFAFTDGSYHRT